MTSTSTIDLRSDTVTRPTVAMRKAMATAELGDDVYAEDPTVNRLQALAATMLMKEAALFLPSGTQSNLCALLAHCERGDEYIVGQHAHTYMYEGGGAAVLGSIQPQPLDFMPDGTIDLATAASRIKPDDPHFPRTRLLCLENTQAGKVLPLDYLESARQFADQHRLGLHLDGARIFNASEKLGVPVSEISQYFDSVSVCLSKGLCAPVGSVLCGSREFIKEALRWRKMLGGGMRQAGIVAAAGVVALEEQVQFLRVDHKNALSLAKSLNSLPALDIDIDEIQTNIFYARVRKRSVGEMARRLAKLNILVAGRGEQLRLVTHFDFREEYIDTVAEAFERVA